MEEKVVNLTEVNNDLRLLDGINYQMIAGVEKPEIGERFYGLKIDPYLSFNEARASTKEWNTSPVKQIIYITQQLAIVETTNSKILVTQI